MSIITQIVDRLHVSTSLADALLSVQESMRPGAWDGLSDDDRAAITRDVARRLEQNRKLYNFVQR